MNEDKPNRKRKICAEELDGSNRRSTRSMARIVLANQPEPEQKPTVLDIISTVAPQLQQVVLSSASVIDLCELTRVSKSMRLVAESTLRNRTVDISIKAHGPTSKNGRSISGPGCFRHRFERSMMWFDYSDHAACAKWVVIRDKNGITVDVLHGRNMRSIREFHHARRLPVLLGMISKYCRINKLHCESLTPPAGDHRQLFDLKGFNMLKEDALNPYIDEEVFINELFIPYDGVYILRYMTPMNLEVKFSARYDKFVLKKFLKASHYRGLFAAKSIIFHNIGSIVDDEILCRLVACQIIIGASRRAEDTTRYFCNRMKGIEYVGNTAVTRRGILTFIEQWLTEKRIIHHVALLLSEEESKIGSSEFARLLTEELRESKNPPTSTELVQYDNDLEGKMKFTSQSNQMIYKEPFVLRIFRSDGKKLTFVLREESEPKKTIEWMRKQSLGNIITSKFDSNLAYSLVIELFDVDI